MPRRRVPRPYPLDALAPYLDAHAERGNYHAARPFALADLLGLSRRTAHRYLADGALPERLADRAAAALGMHPGELWLEWWTLAPTDPEPA